MRKSWLAFAVLVIFLLSGCSGSSSGPSATSGGPDATSDTNGETTAHSVPTASSSSGPSHAGDNHAPTGTFLASVKAGPAPLVVNFTLTGSDTDGDPLAWSFDADSDGTTDADGTTFPGTPSFTYKLTGLQNATYTLTDGKSDVTFHLDINVTGPIAPPPAPVVFTGHIVTPDPYPTGPGGDCFLAITTVAGGPSDVVGNIHQFTDPLDGWTYSFAESGYWATFWQGTTAILANGESGTVPDGATNVWVCGKAPTTANTDYTLTVTAPPGFVAA